MKGRAPGASARPLGVPGLLPGVSALLLTGCAVATPGPRGPVVSPSGTVYEPGVPPAETRYSQTATLYLASDDPSRALERALEGVAADPGNPVHYFLAGVAHARLGAYERADVMLSEAQRIYPAYELEVEPERLAAWAEAFNRGSEAYAEGREEDALDAWRGATLMYRLRPEAHRNLAALLSEDGRVDEAVDVYRDLLRGLERVPATRVLDANELRHREADRAEAREHLSELLLATDRFADAEPLLRARLEREPGSARIRQDLATALAGLNRWEEARAIYDGLLSERGLAEAELHNLGVALFRGGEPTRAAEAFHRLAAARPDSRDAWYNYANVLLAAEDWDGIVAIEARLLALDPLGESVQLIVARAHLERGDEASARAGLRRIDAAPVHLEGLHLRGEGVRSTLQGRVIGNEAAPGSVLRLRVTFYGEDRHARTETAIRAPAPGDSDTFEVSVPLRASAYRYEVVSLVRPGG